MNERGGTSPRVGAASAGAPETDDLAAEVDERLVVHPESAVDGTTEVALEGGPVERLGAHLGVEYDELADRVDLWRDGGRSRPP
jgi:hypothetical protein